MRKSCTKFLTQTLAVASIVLQLSLGNASAAKESDPKVCFPQKKVHADSVKRRTTAESEYNKSLTRYDQLSRSIDRVILDAVNKINGIDGTISGIFLQMGASALEVLVDKLTCKNPNFQSFCTQNKGEFIRLAQKYAGLLGQRRAAFKILEAIDRTQSSKHRRLYGIAVQKWVVLIQAINLERIAEANMNGCVEAAPLTLGLRTAAEESSAYCPFPAEISASVLKTSPIELRTAAAVGWLSWFTKLVPPEYANLGQGLVDSITQLANGGFLDALAKKFYDAWDSVVGAVLKKAQDFIGKLFGGGRASYQALSECKGCNPACPLPPSAPREVTRESGCLKLWGLAEATGFSFCTNKLVNNVIGGT